MILKIIRIILYAIGGFFTYTMNLMAFTSMSSIPASPGIKFGIVAIFGVIGLVFILIAAATNLFHECKNPIGIVLLSDVGMTALTVVSLFCMQLSPEFTKLFPEGHLDLFSDYLTGGIITLLLFIVGIILIRTSQKMASEPT